MEEIIIKLAENLCKYVFKKQVGQRTGISNGIDNYAEGFLGREILAIVKKHAMVVSGAAVANGIPGGAAVSVTVIVASTWKMYYDINNKLGISFSENFLKSIASGIVSNLASNTVAAGATNLLSFIPGIGTIGSIVGGMAINRTSIYTAAVAYLKILCQIAENGGSFDESSVSSYLPSQSSGHNKTFNQNKTHVNSTKRNEAIKYPKSSKNSFYRKSPDNWNDATTRAINLLYMLEKCSYAERKESLALIEGLSVPARYEAAWNQILRIWRTYVKDLRLNTKTLPNPDGVRYSQRPFPITSSLGVQDVIKEIIKHA